MVKRNIIFLIILIIFSVLGGTVGGILVRSYLLNSSFDIPLFGDINVGGQYQRGNLVISQPKNVIVEQDERLAGVISDSRQSLVFLYPKKTSSADEAGDVILDGQTLAENYYAPSESAGTGLALTSDGWIITAAALAKPSAFVAVNYDGTLFDIEKTVFDKLSGYTFAKIASANLVAARFSEKQDVWDGKTVVGVTGQGVALTYITQARRDLSAGTAKSTENFYEAIAVADAELTRGTVIVGLDGAVAGLYDSAGLVTPMYQYAQLLSGMLRTGGVSRSSLGVRYVNAYEFIGPEKLKGALVTKDVRGVAVVSGSPAARAGILSGDIIIAVDGIRVDADNSLSGLIQSRQPGEEIELLIVREGEEMSVKATLESLK